MEITTEVLKKYKLNGIHPAAARLPLMNKEEFVGLVESMRVYGQQTPIQITSDAMVLDGRNRILASLIVGIDVLDSEITDPSDPIVWVMSQNLQRRSLTVGQRAMLGRDIADMPPGRPWPKSDNPPDPAGYHPNRFQYTQAQGYTCHSRFEITTHADEGLPWNMFYENETESHRKSLLRQAASAKIILPRSLRD